MQTGYAIIVAGFFVGAAIQFAGADIASSTGHGNGGGSAVGGFMFLLAGVLGFILYCRALLAQQKRQS